VEHLKGNEEGLNRKGRLIRQDSSESLIEMIQAEKFYQSILGGA
jgi:hypothetical protein